MIPPCPTSFSLFPSTVGGEESARDLTEDKRGCRFQYYLGISVVLDVPVDYHE